MLDELCGNFVWMSLICAIEIFKCISFKDLLGVPGVFGFLFMQVGLQLKLVNSLELFRFSHAKSLCFDGICPINL